ncbi:MAG: YybS family protein [Deltaproteobacteria bacterium]|nr:YybS family protein [Deltaproteobacteria bacterium]
MNSQHGNSAPVQNLSLVREVSFSVAATLLCYCAVLFVPIMGFLAGAFTPLPCALFYLRWGSPQGFWVPAAAAAAGCLLLAALSASPSIPYFLAMLLLGFILGFGMRNQWSVEKTILWGSLAVFAIGSALFVSAHVESGQNPLKVLEDDLRQSFLLAVQEAAGLSPEKAPLEEALQRLVPLMARLAPGAVLSSLLIVSWLNLLILRRYCRLYNLTSALRQEWSHWKAPEILVWGVIGSGFILLIPAPSFLKTLGLNLLVVLGTIYLFQGMAVLGFFFNRWKLPRFLKAFLYAFVLLQQIATLLAICMGFFDMWFDFRRLSPRSNSNA